MSKELVVFAGSQEIVDLSLAEELTSDLRAFLESNRAHISRILFGGGNHGVMGMLFRAAKDADIPIHGFSLEIYRQHDEGNGVDLTFFASDYARMLESAKRGDAFVALPGGTGTVAETLGVKNILHETKEQKTIYVPAMFTALHTLIRDLGDDKMLHSSDASLIRCVGSLKEIDLSV